MHTILLMEEANNTIYVGASANGSVIDIQFFLTIASLLPGFVAISYRTLVFLPTPEEQKNRHDMSDDPPISQVHSMYWCTELERKSHVYLYPHRLFIGRPA